MHFNAAVQLSADSSLNRRLLEDPQLVALSTQALAKRWPASKKAGTVSLVAL